MEKKVLIVTEANVKVASGHLFECIALYNELNRNGIAAYLMINADMLPGLKTCVHDSYYEYTTNIQQETECLTRLIEEKRINIVVFNLREITNVFLQEINSKLENSVTTIIIDEFGRRKLEADIIINPMIDNYYWNYETGGKVYCGARYLMLPQNLAQYHEKEKLIREKIEIVTISMGGVDAKGTTIKLAKWLNELLDGVRINIVLGGGFMYMDELKETIQDMKNVFVYQNITYLYDLFMESDIAICAGGNTLHELAAIGLPALVIPSMLHEVRNGKAFEQQGFAICCEDAEYITKNLIQESISRLYDDRVRKKMRNCGKKISDGRGTERIYRILLSEIK